MTSEFKLAPSILSADFSDLGQALSQCESGGAPWVHVDVMDNQFVQNLTIGPPVVKSLRPKTKKFLDVHLMVINPEDLVEPFARAGADNITFHIEATNDPDELINLIKSCGCKVGISLKPKTPLSDIFPLLDKIDVVLVMSVEPGFGGQKFIDSVLTKVTKVRDTIDKKNLDIRLEVDGGINLENIASVAEAGADTFVAGSAIFNQEDYSKIIKQMRSSLEAL